MQGDDGHDRLLPIANVGRIMKQILPPNAKISKESKETMQECVTEFISFVTCEASDKCCKENRKTLNGDDICWALGALGFNNFDEAVQRYLVKYREFERERASNQYSRASGTTLLSQDNGGEGEKLALNNNTNSQQQPVYDDVNISLGLTLLEGGKSNNHRPSSS